MANNCIDCGRPLEKGEKHRCPNCTGKLHKKRGKWATIGLGIFAVAALAIKAFTGVDIGKPS